MTAVSLLRDYENPELSLQIRLPSLARRFPCLKAAPGLDPFCEAEFHAWIKTRPPGSAARHAGLLILNLGGPGPWEPFDAIGAVTVFDEANRAVFANWTLSWRPPTI